MSTSVLANSIDLGMTSSQTEVQAERPRLLLLDDDRLYGRILQREAERLGIDLCVCQSLAEAEAMSRTFHPDAAILDYYLDSTTGEKAARVLEATIPVLLISASRPGLPHLRDHWPSNVRRFLPKTVGPRIILQAALTEHWTRSGTTLEISDTPIFRFLWPMLILTALFLVVSSFLIPAMAPLAPGTPGLIWDRLDLSRINWTRA